MAEEQPIPEPAEAIKDLRDMVFSTEPGDIGLTRSAAAPAVWGIVMEIGYPKGLASLVVLADGTASLYLGHGGGIIGAGAHAAVKAAATDLLATAERLHEGLEAADGFPYPDIGRVRFHFLTWTGPLTAEAAMDDLGHRRHALSDLFHAGHRVITEMRRIEQQRQDQ